MTLPEPDICERAYQARDRRFDGRFIVAVLSTGIYCRPVCPARIPAKENVRFYVTPAAASDAGYRPCLRCRPETASRLPEWSIGSELVVRGLRLIDSGFLDSRSVTDLGAQLGVSARHLNRLMSAELGSTANKLARHRRVALAKRLIDGSNLTMAQIAMTAGYRSLRTFNKEMQLVYHQPPSSLRRSERHQPGGITLNLPVRLPYNADWVFDFLARRALAGHEVVEGYEYRRLLNPNGDHWLRVRWENEQLTVKIPTECAARLSDLVVRVRRLFDLDADSEVIDSHLGAHRILQQAVKVAGGLRVPGAWDGFETAVRAILGQQVSVARATDLAAKLIDAYGEGQFPTPEALQQSTPGELGMPGARGRAIAELARRVAANELVLDEATHPTELVTQLQDIPGIGPWTAGYVAMRVGKDPNGFPDRDWVVLKVLETTAAKARKLAADWQPWRAYAVMYLWWMSSQPEPKEVGD